MAPETGRISRNNALCRFCSVDIESTQAAGINLLRASDLPVIVKEVYEVEILSTDQCSTTICVPCFQKLMTNYTHRIRMMQKKKIVKLNQLVLLSQVNVLTVAPTPPPEASSDLDEPSSDVLIHVQQLVPVVVDCLKEPNYLAALWPLDVTLDGDDVKPLVYLCRTCKKKFDTKGAYETHEALRCCVPCCRYCRSTIGSDDHSCIFQTKYAELQPHITGSSRYCSQSTTVDKDDDPDAVVCIDLTSRDDTLQDDAGAQNQTIATPPKRREEKRTTRDRSRSTSTSTSEHRTAAMATPTTTKRPSEAAKRPETGTANETTLSTMLDMYHIDISSEEELTLSELMDGAVKKSNPRQQESKSQGKKRRVKRMNW